MFGLIDARPRVHVQSTGQVFNWHLDTLDLLFPGVDPNRLIRITVMLEDWQPGQFFLYGTYNYQNWKAGDITWFRWQDVPHATANASLRPRCTLQITGIRTDFTDRLLKNGMESFQNSAQEVDKI